MKKIRRLLNACRKRAFLRGGLGAVPQEIFTFFMFTFRSTAVFCPNEATIFTKYNVFECESKYNHEYPRWGKLKVGGGNFPPPSKAPGGTLQ